MAKLLDDEEEEMFWWKLNSETLWQSVPRSRGNGVIASATRLRQYSIAAVSLDVVENIGTILNHGVSISA